VKIPIQNIYYLLCFAWRFIPDDLALDVGAVQSPDVLNLCGHVLNLGIDRLLRRAIDQGYVELTEETSRLRGRIDLTATVKALSWLNARAVCHFDELTPDILHNRILRTTVQLLSRAPIDPALQSRLRETDHQLSGIATIGLDASLFRRVQLHQNNSFYVFLMRVCELVYISLLPDRSGESPSWFRDVLSDDDLMAAVFEEFIRNFYSLKQSQFMVTRTQPKWNATAIKPDDLQFLPTMNTDVTLSSASRTIIIDAKYYRDALQTKYGSRTVHSDHLYQLIAYLRGSDQKLAHGASIEGILVYPVGEQCADFSYNIDGYPVKIFTLNLAQPWHCIEADLIRLISSPMDDSVAA
jgi:5-methylcytosine-specific restriction enzyme subunit McrC